MIDGSVIPVEEMNTDKVCELTVCVSEPEAAILVATLADCGIKAEMTGALTANFRADSPGFVRILVLGDDLETAREILGEYNAERTTPPSRRDDEEEGDRAGRRRMKVLIGVMIMVVIVVYFAVNSIGMF